jgi:hypothetical protein
MIERALAVQLTKVHEPIKSIARLLKASQQKTAGEDADLQLGRPSFIPP